MHESICRTCRWWTRGLKKGSEFGTCKNSDLNMYLTGSRAGFSPPGSFSCSCYEPSVAWAEDAAEEIDDWYRGLYTTLPEAPEDRIRKFEEIILRHLDTQGAHAKSSSTT